MFELDKKLKDIKRVLELNKTEIIEILKELETEDVALSEYNLSISALENNKYGIQKARIISSYLPMNLPLFSLIVYTIIPSLCGTKSFYRPSTKIMKQSEKIHSILNLDNYDIYLFNGSRKDFFKQHTANSDVVIFVGKPENADELSSKLTKRTLFLYFGVGQNPVVVSDNANIDIASKKIVDTIMFNYGQDCGKPNIILCHKNSYEELLRNLIEKIDKKQGCKTTIKNMNSLNETIQLLLSERENIIYGGNVDLKNNTLDPTVIVSPLKINSDTYNEYFAPVFRIMVYECDTDLKKYFFETKYKKENMNISLFGSCDFVESLPASIILHDEMVPEMDNGFCEFGGYGENTSYIKYCGIKINKPILINREIEFFYDRNLFNTDAFSQCIYDKNPSKNVLYLEYYDMINKLFSNNMFFSFLFGSYVKNRQKCNSDLDMLICLNKDNEKMISYFREWYFKFHYLYGLLPDSHYPGEILTIQRLEDIIEKSKYVTFDIKNSSSIFDLIFYTQIFTDKKKMILGREEELLKYEAIFQKFVPEFCHQIFEMLIKKDAIKTERDYMKCLFALSNNDLLYFSKKLNFDEEQGNEYVGIINGLDDGLLNKCLRRKL